LFTFQRPKPTMGISRPLLSLTVGADMVAVAKLLKELCVLDAADGAG
jgi:hypothetical protein